MPALATPADRCLRTRLVSPRLPDAGRPYRVLTPGQPSAAAAPGAGAGARAPPQEAAWLLPVWAGAEGILTRSDSAWRLPKNGVDAGADAVWSICV